MGVRTRVRARKCVCKYISVGTAGNLYAAIYWAPTVHCSGCCRYRSGENTHKSLPYGTYILAEEGSK